MTRRARHCMVIAVVAVSACTDESVEPSPTSDAPSPPDLPTSEVPEVPTAPSPKRTILERNPFGNVSAPDNLLWDGDFEWSSPFASQYGWFQLPSSLTLDEPVMGPICRSGVKCARVGKNDDILGVGVGARDEGLYASVHVKFEADDDGIVSPCSEASVTIVDIGFGPPFDEDVALTLVAPVPDVTGYCTFAGLLSPRNNKPYMLVSNHGAGPMLVDDAVLLRASSSSVPAGAIPPSALPVNEARRARVESGKAAARALPRGGEGAPNPAKEALERHQRERVRARNLRAPEVKP